MFGPAIAAVETNRATGARLDATDVFRTIVAALTKNRGVQLVLSVGDRTNPKDLGPVPKNTIIMQRTPQLQLLKHASVCITHSGLNKVLESLAQGVPQVSIPVTFGQPGVAARIAHHKTGVVASSDKLTPEHLSDLLSQVLEDPSYRNNARRMQMAISEGQQVIGRSRPGRSGSAIGLKE